MPGGAVDEQVGRARRQHRRLLLLAVVVRHEVDRLLVDVGEHLGGELLQPALGVAVGRRRVAVDRAEVALAVDQRVAHGEVLRHAHQRLVGRRVAVRVVLAQHVADDARALHVRAVPDVVAPRAWRTARAGAPASGRRARRAGRARRSRSSRNRGRSAASPPRVKSGGFLWRRIPCEKSSNFIMRGTPKLAQATVFSRKIALCGERVAVIKWRRVREQKNRGGDTMKTSNAHSSLPASLRARRLRHAAGSTATRARAARRSRHRRPRRRRARLRSAAGAEARSAKPEPKKPIGGEPRFDRAVRVQQGDAHRRREEEARRRSGRQAARRRRRSATSTSTATPIASARRSTTSGFRRSAPKPCAPTSCRKASSRDRSRPSASARPRR